MVVPLDTKNIGPLAGVELKEGIGCNMRHDMPYARSKTKNLTGTGERVKLVFNCRNQLLHTTDESLNVCKFSKAGYTRECQSTMWGVGGEGGEAGIGIGGPFERLGMSYLNTRDFCASRR